MPPTSPRQGSRHQMSHIVATCVPKDFHTGHITLDLWVKGRRAASGEHVLGLQLLLGAGSDRWTGGGSVTLQLTARAVAHGHGPVEHPRNGPQEFPRTMDAESQTWKIQNAGM